MTFQLSDDKGESNEDIKIPISLDSLESFYKINSIRVGDTINCEGLNNKNVSIYGELVSVNDTIINVQFQGLPVYELRLYDGLYCFIHLIDGEVGPYLRLYMTDHYLRVLDTYELSSSQGDECYYIKTKSVYLGNRKFRVFNEFVKDDSIDDSEMVRINSEINILIVNSGIQEKMINTIKSKYEC